MNRFFNLFVIVLAGTLFTACQSKNEDNYVFISVEEYNDAVYASWIGQIIGNTYGLGYEFKFIDEPGPDSFPYGYSFTLDDLRKHDGAYSDDDTDIEYMYLTQMEKNGIEPTYYNLAEAWKTHVKERIWFANRMAVTLMHAGHYPPVTGAMGYNHEWFQIDPQLVNEIWAITAPGMVNYAVEKSEFAARITSDSFGVEPTLHYAAMFSAAFYEKDIHSLIEIGTNALPEEAVFAEAVEYVKSLYNQYPNDWQIAREKVKNKYYVSADYNSHSWPAVDAVLNGAYGIMALLYGQGDFQKTLDYSCAFGMDADNQAATMCGLLGVLNGFESIPTDLMYPLEDAQWEMPFNDNYKMITREGLSDASITELAERTAKQGEKIILANGGEKIVTDGVEYYKINTSAKFIAPFELNSFPEFFVEVDKPFEYPIYTGGLKNVEIIVRGTLPEGVVIKNDAIVGIPTTVGRYSFELTGKLGDKEITQAIEFTVHSKNIASDAKEVLFNKNAINHNIEIIRNETIKETYRSKKEGSIRENDYYGYLWDEPQSISALSFNNGANYEWAGWFTSFGVQYLKDGEWISVEEFKISPDLNMDNSQWLKPSYMDYTIEFPVLETKGIRIVGLGGGIEKDPANAHLGVEYSTSISELRVFEN